MQTKLELFLNRKNEPKSSNIAEENPSIEISPIDLGNLDIQPADIDTLTKNNDLAIQMIESGQLDRQLINKLFNGLGVEYVNTEGLKGIYKKRMATLQQYFTPTTISELLVKVLKIPESATVLDNTCGSGRMFHALPNRKLITGIELEERAFIVAKALYPQACIINDDAKNHLFHNNFDYVLINPPFNIQWYIPELENIGYKGAILSHLACLEIGVKALKPNGYLVAILPANTFKLDSTIKFHRWLNTQVTEVLRIELPSTIFLRANYPSTVFIYKKATNDLKYIGKELILPSLEAINELIGEIDNSILQDIQKYADSRISVDPVIITPLTKEKVKRKKKVLPLVDVDEITVDHNGNSLSLKPNGLMAELKIANIFARYNGHKWDSAVKCYVSEVSRLKSLNEIWSKDKKLLDHPILQQLQTMNVKLTIKPNILKYIAKKIRWFKKQIVPFEQAVKETDQSNWSEVYTQEGVRTTLKHDYDLAKRDLLALSKKYPFIENLYAFQMDDIIRLSLKDSAIDCSQMGLGKTRVAITLALLRNKQHTLIILPKRLIHTWEKEFEKLNKSMAKENRIDYKIIENEGHCKKLAKINLISYYTLSVKTWYNKATVTFADKLRRRFKMIIADEAHAFGKKLSHRTEAIRKFKAKYWLFLTGTPIGNTVKNLWSLCDVIFKADTPRFPYSTSEFRKTFVTVEMVTPQFEDTLCKGKTSQQLPKIKNLDVFLELVKYMWIRRVKTEPEVERDIQIVQPKIEVRELLADEEHWKVYKRHLDHFADLFIQYLHPELHEHDRVKAAVVLAQMGNLQFVSTIPQHTKFDIFGEEYQYRGKLTVIQNELLKILAENYATEKILVISQRPDFCVLMNQELKKHGIPSGIFTGQVDIDKRNETLDTFEESDSLNILLCSINTIKEGINIPQGTMVLIVDLDWTYQKLEQAYSRVLRPETKESPTVLILYYKGFIDQYLWQHIRAKKAAVLSGIDRRKDTEEVEWVHWKDFTYNMLKDLGYNLD